MGVRIIHDREEHVATIYCSCTDWSLGPVFYADSEKGLDAEEVAQLFLQWFGGDPRKLKSSTMLEQQRDDFLRWLADLKPCHVCGAYQRDNAERGQSGLTMCDKCVEDQEREARMDQEDAR